MTTNEIVDSIYKAYGTDSGILFGIKEKDITKAIVEFTVNRMGDERQALLDENKKLKQLAKECLFIFGNEANYPEGTIGYQIAQKCRELQ